MPRRLVRRIGYVLVAFLLLAVGVWAVVVRPRQPAIAFLDRLAGPLPTWDALERVGARRSAGARPASVEVPGPAMDAPRIVVVAGVTPEGVLDPRVLRVVVALRDAGFAVTAPDLVGLAHPGEDEALVDDVVAAWHRALRGEGHPGPKGEVDDAGGRRVDRIAMLGVSFGAGVVIQALARGAAGDPDPSTVSAVLLVGPPDDAEALASSWFRRAVAPPGTTGSADARSDAGLFARHGIARAAAARRLPADDLARVRAWLDEMGEAPSSATSVPTGLTSAEARRLVAAVVAEAEVSADDLAWVLAGAAPFLRASSPAAAPSLARVRAPVFLIHGVEDALIPVEASRALAARLTSAREVEVLESRLLSHVDVGAPGVAETWRHVTFVQRFFDAAGAK